MAFQGVKLRRLAWSPRLAAALSKSTFPDGKKVAGEIVSGAAEAWELDGIGHAVTRLEVTEAGNVLVMVATEGRGFYTPEFLNLRDGLAIRIATANDATLRIHSRRPGVGRFLKRYGYREELGLGESIYHGRRVEK